MTLTQPLRVTDSNATRWTLPVGLEVAVRPLSASRSIVVVDGRVYRAEALAVVVATR